MIEDGRVYGLGIAMQRLLRCLEAKGLLGRAEVQALLDEATDQLRNMDKNVIDDAAKANAAKAIGLLHLKD